MTESSEFKVQFLNSDHTAWNTDSTFAYEHIGDGAYRKAEERLNTCLREWPHDQWRMIHITTKVIHATHSISDTNPTEFTLVRTCDGDIDDPCNKFAMHRYDAMGSGVDGWLCNYHDAKIVGAKEDNNWGVNND